MPRFIGVSGDDMDGDDHRRIRAVRQRRLCARPADGRQCRLMAEILTLQTLLALVSMPLLISLLS